MSLYTTTIGLEIHAELKTASKMFCGCKNDSDEKQPNVNICPICMGHPGTLPVINREAVRKVLQVGVAVNGVLADTSEFDRKNYFYPDIPKNYQISQYKYPLVLGGELAGIKITRVHLEEDTARSSHESRGTRHEEEEIEGGFGTQANTSGLGSDGFSLVDFNRAGVPLMELVTEPVIHSAEEAMKFGRELQLLLQYLGVSEANMEKGEMRIEVNISVSKGEKFGTKVEVKNINSFKAAGRAIEYEYKRQTELLERGEVLVQETRGFDENKGITFSQRSKEQAHDYRYFPEPDLPKLLLSEVKEFSVKEIRKTLLEIPEQKRARYTKDYGIKVEDVETLINNQSLAHFFEISAKDLNKEETKILSNYITSDLVGLVKNSKESQDSILLRIVGVSIAGLMHMVALGSVSSRGAKDILKIMSEKGGDPKEIAEARGLIQKSDSEEIKKIMKEIVSAYPDNLKEYKDGKESLLQFFVGLGMKAMKGSGNPQLIKKVLIDLISN